eukprot:TRINITY_DN4551_c1_g1_i3.p1 TRINITY_DN4551_c1_g1~~TRINITY_DN4551_c1_g1_i3.p1  ORF type:complete len:492 (-),score=116.34 TRINITY_DN4551_c1_g1_i3:508-1983(-)
MRIYLVAIFCTLVLVSAFAAQPDDRCAGRDQHLINGDFHPTTGESTGYNVEVGAGNDRIHPWVVTKNSVQHSLGNWPHPLGGDHSVEIKGLATVQQPITLTTSSRAYTLHLDLAANFECGSPLKHLQVRVLDQSNNVVPDSEYTIEYNATGNTREDMQWESHRLSFYSIEGQDQYTLELSNLDHSPCGPIVTSTFLCAEEDLQSIIERRDHLTAEEYNIHRRQQTCPPVDIVFVVDTSGSMDDEATALCPAITNVINALKAEKITISQYKIYGITDTNIRGMNCFNGHVWGTFGQKVGNDPCPWPQGGQESWAPASAIVAQKFPWTRGAVRVVVPISDEGPCQGNYPRGRIGGPREQGTITNAIQVAKANGAIISPIRGTNMPGYSAAQYADVWKWMQQLAQGTGGVASNSNGVRTQVGDLTNNIIGIVRRACIVAIASPPPGAPSRAPPPPPPPPPPLFFLPTFTSPLDLSFLSFLSFLSPLLLPESPEP